MTDSQTPATTASTLFSIRLMWGAMLMSVIIFTCIALFMGPMQGLAKSEDSIAPTLFYLSLGMLVVSTGVGFFIRGQTFKKGWEGDVIKPAAYFTGTLLSIASIEGPALFGGVSLMLADQVFPFILTPALGILLIVLSFPTGKPMFPHSPRLSDDNPYQQS